MDKNQNDLKQLLEESGLSQSALAQKLGISRQHLHNIVKLNRKSKYSSQIFDLFKQKKEGQPANSDFNPGKHHRIESLPMVFPEDLIRIYIGEASLNLLSKPFYAKYPFANFNDLPNHFCLRLSELFSQTENFYLAIGAFRFIMSPELKSGQIALLYLPELQKSVVGRIKINPDTWEKFIVNNNTMYTLGIHAILLAECTQIIHVLP